MIIVIAADILGEKNNGTSVATYNLIDYLKRKGHEVRVICGDKNRVNEPNYYIVDLRSFGPLNSYVDENGVSLSIADPKVILKALEGADLVHIPVPFAIGKATAKIADKLNIPITASFHIQAENVTSHIYMMHSKIAHNLVYRNFWNKCYKYVDCIHFPTRFINADFEKTVGPTNAYIISNGVKSLYQYQQVDKPKEFQDKFVILYTGRYSREKMHKTLINAMKYSRYEKQIQLIFAGDGPLREKIEKKISFLTNQPVLGLHDASELVKIINYSDLYVHCAYAELESIACLEAIKCGLVPIINNSEKSATRFFALDPYCVYKKNNPRSLAKRIDYWIEHEEERLALKEKYMEYAANFDFEKCMGRMEKMMYEAIEMRQYKIVHQNEIHGRVVGYTDALNDDFAPTENISLHRIKVMDNFKYLHKNFFWKIASFILYRLLAQPILTIYAFLKGIRVHQRHNLKKIKKGGYFLYGNHTCIDDGYISQVLVEKRKRTYIIANPDAVSIKGVKNIVMMLGCLPLPNSLRSSKNFLEAIKYRINNGNVITVYPEAHIWPYATNIRPFLDTSFLYPSKLNLPVVAMVTTYRKNISLISKKERKPKIDVTISEPFYPKEEFSSKENAKYLRDKVYDFMVEVSKKNENYDYITYVDVGPNSAKK